MVKQIHIDKIEKLAAEHEEKRNPTPDEPPADPEDQQPKDDRDKFLRFDPSVGNQAQKTPGHPAGDMVPVPTRDEYNFMKFQEDAQENRCFRDTDPAQRRQD